MVKHTSSILVVVVLAALTGCATNAARKQAEQVAKDWNFTIRAAQVIPVYPMTTDVRPGDVYLSRTPVNTETKLWKESGYIPIEAHLARLPVWYGDFYNEDAGITNANTPPSNPSDVNPDWLNGLLEPTAPPLVGFPSYSFRASFQTGFAGAAPIKGVPVGLSYLNVSDASANLTITDASTYGIDVAQLYKTVSDWAVNNAVLLDQYVPSDPNGEKAYLRVVYRVYQAKQFDIGMYSTSGTGISSSIGAKKDVPQASLQRRAEPGDAEATDTPETGADTEPDTTDTTEHSTYRVDYQSLLEDLTDAANKEPEIDVETDALGGAIESAAEKAEALLPGASVRFTSASERSVSFKQRFTKPIAVGYHAFDVEIMRGGNIGPPMSTLSRVDGSAIPLPNFIYQPDDTSETIKAWLYPGGSDSGPDQERINALRDWMGDHDIDIPMTDFLNDPRFRYDRLIAIEELDKPTPEGDTDGQESP